MTQAGTPAALEDAGQLRAHRRVGVAAIAVFFALLFLGGSRDPVGADSPPAQAQPQQQLQQPTGPGTGRDRDGFGPHGDRDGFGPGPGRGGGGPPAGAVPQAPDSGAAPAPSTGSGVAT